MTTKKFRFAVQGAAAPSGAAWRELARKAEALGYSTLHIPDHYVDAASNGGQALAAIPALAVAGAVTETLRIGTRVLCIDYHQPVVLAKSAATLDLLSDGRLELGLGAGWVASEYASMGLDIDDAPTRITRLADTVAFLKAFFAGETLDLDNSAVRVHNFKGQPVPVQTGGIPIMIGGGARRVLTLAGQVADIVSFNFNNKAGAVTPASIQSATDALMHDRLAWVKAGAGARFDQIELEVGAYFTVVTDDALPTAEKMGGMFGISAEEMIAHPNALIGSVDAICDRLVERRERYGISYVTVSDRNIDAFAPVVARLAGS
jgi:probable F420-dependent oxidoreductase